MVVKEKTILLIQLAINHQVNNLNDKNLSLIYQTLSFYPLPEATHYAMHRGPRSESRW